MKYGARELYPFEIAREVAVASVSLSGAHEIHELDEFVSEVSGVDIGYAREGLQDAYDRRQIFRTQDGVDVAIYSLNEDSFETARLVNAPEIPLAHGKTVPRNVLAQIVRNKKIADAGGETSGDASDLARELIELIHKD